MDAADWYESRCVGLGSDFGRYFLEFLEDLDDFPRINARIEEAPPDRELREGLMRKYPYRVAYEIIGDEIVVLSVTHTRRGHAGWEGRL
jgi:microsomal dipeptidase-like Zn-dependent dipeptidase